VILGITGASGVELSLKLREVLKEKKVETFVVVSDSAKIVFEYETRMKWKDVERKIKRLASEIYSPQEIHAPIASGTFPVDGMVVLPCSMKTLAAIANGFEFNLIVRAASVCLKEKRKLLLCVRETPLRIVHLENMLKVAKEGAIILPLMMSFYGKSKNTLELMVNNIIGKILNIFGIEYEKHWRWKP
jgi:4-hydroxy-3-polyprenylbenzoate decarboxylase